MLPLIVGHTHSNGAREVCIWISKASHNISNAACDGVLGALPTVSQLGVDHTGQYGGTHSGTGTSVCAESVSNVGDPMVDVAVAPICVTGAVLGAVHDAMCGGGTITADEGLGRLNSAPNVAPNSAPKAVELVEHQLQEVDLLLATAVRLERILTELNEVQQLVTSIGDGVAKRNVQPWKLDASCQAVVGYLEAEMATQTAVLEQRDLAVQTDLESMMDDITDTCLY